MPAFEIQRNQEPSAARCSASECRQPILWIRTVAGRAMCLDSYQPIESDDGRLLVDASATHWATCVARQRFTRPRKGVPA